jgi:hypothetical protein
MLPDVDCQERLISLSHWILCIRGVDYEKLLILLRQPGPTRAKVPDSLGCKFLKEVVDTAPLFLNQLQELAIWCCFIGSYAIPEESMIPMLKSIVQDLSVFAAE